jgi:hypothetical protein
VHGRSSAGGAERCGCPPGAGGRLLLVTAGGGRGRGREGDRQRDTERGHIMTMKC